MDKEKVIKGLEEISNYFFNVYHHSKDREEINKAKDRCDVVEDALALLKEPKALKPFIRHGNWVFQCGKCKAIIEYGDKFCRQCGQEVKWK